MFKRLGVLLLVVFCAVSALADDRESKPIEIKAEQNAWDGFRGIKWGEDIKAIPDMILQQDFGDGFAAYTRNNDDLTLGTVTLEQVWYGFYKGRFVWAAMVGSANKWRTYETVLEENKQVESMHSIVSARFGVETGKPDPARPQNIFARISEWKHSDVLVEFSPRGTRTTLWQEDKFPQHSYVELTYLPIAKEMAKDKNAAQDAEKANREAGIEKAVLAIQTTKEGWDGFRGIKWGTQFNSISGMVVEEDFGNGAICYTRDVDKNLVLAGVQVDKALYCFYKGRLGWGAMLFKGGQDNEILREILAKRYDHYSIVNVSGKGKVKVPSKPPYDWTKGDISLKYFEKGMGYVGNKYPDNTYFEVTYLPIVRQKAREDEAMQKAADKIKKDKLRDATKGSF
jgi:hypothetical protein